MFELHHDGRIGRFSILTKYPKGIKEFSDEEVEPESSRKPVAYLYAFSVAKQYRGKGYSTRFLKYIEAKAKAEGFEELWLGCYPHMKKYYNKHGFNKSGSHRDKFGWGIGCPAMKKKL